MHYTNWHIIKQKTTKQKVSLFCVLSLSITITGQVGDGPVTVTYSSVTGLYPIPKVNTVVPFLARQALHLHK